MKKTFGQIAFEEHYREVGYTCDMCVAPELWERVAAAVLAAQWRPVTEPPEDQDKYVLVRGGRLDTALFDFANISSDRTHWAEIPPFAEPKPAWTLTRHMPGFRKLEDGEEWHRNDFTEGMLPEGWRPLLLGEIPQPENGDQFYIRAEGWCKCQNSPGANAFMTLLRTRRPLPPTVAEKEREEFEAWAASAGYAFTDEGLRQWMFIGWQAARKQKGVK